MPPRPSHLRLSASLKAEALAATGFTVVAPGVYRLASGLEMPCIEMQKNLAAVTPSTLPKE
ncbi:MAG: hypothetical protein ACFCVB_04640 [Nodosilinea sp.]